MHGKRGEVEPFGLRVARGDQHQRQHDRVAEHGKVQRPDTRHPPEQERWHRAPALHPNAVGIAQPDHESGQEEEEVDREIAFRQHRQHQRRQCKREPEVVEHYPPRRDPARAGQGAKLGHAGASRARRIGRKLSPARARAQ